MPANVQSVISELLYYVRSNDRDMKNWYVGLSNDPLETIIVEHGLDEEKDQWVYRQCLTHEDAQKVLSHFVITLGCTTNSQIGKGIKDQAKFVYLYKKQKHTNP